MKRILWIALLGLCGFGLITAAIIAAGANPLESLQGLLKGSLGSPNAISGTLKEMTPLLMAGVAVYIALKAGLFNIGVEGQLTVGACGCAFVVLHVELDGAKQRDHNSRLDSLAALCGMAMLWATTPVSLRSSRVLGIHAPRRALAVRRLWNRCAATDRALAIPFDSSGPQ